MGREEKRKKDRAMRKKAKSMLTDEQLKRVTTATINEVVADRLNATWDKLSTYFIDTMRGYRISEERVNAIIRDFARAVEIATREELNHD